MSPLKPFDRILEVIANTEHYAIGDFLVDFFRVTGRSERHGKMLAAFLRGTTTYGVGEVLEHLDTVAGRFENPGESVYSLTTPYPSLKSGHAALTSYAVQKVRHQLSVEQHKAVGVDNGLHVFGPHKKTDPLNLRISWDTYGATTFKDVEDLLRKHQPLTFDLIQNLVIPERHEPGKVYRYRPPNFVCEKQTSCIPSPTHDRLRHR